MIDSKLEKRLESLARQRIAIQMHLVEQGSALNALTATVLRMFPPEVASMLAHQRSIEMEKAQESLEILRAQLKALDQRAPSSRSIQ